MIIIRIKDHLFGSRVKGELKKLKKQLRCPLQDFKNYQLVKVKSVEKVVDGDTLWLLFEDHTQVKARLLMVDTPELESKGNKQLYSINATEFVKSKMKKANEIQVKRDHHLWDPYKRLLVLLYLDGKLLQEELLKEGLARTCDLDGNNTELIKRLTQLESEARTNKKKIWGIKGFVRPRKGFHDHVKKRRRRRKRKT